VRLFSARGRSHAGRPLSLARFGVWGRVAFTWAKARTALPRKLWLEESSGISLSLSPHKETSPRVQWTARHVTTQRLSKGFKPHTATSRSSRSHPRLSTWTTWTTPTSTLTAARGPHIRDCYPSQILRTRRRPHRERNFCYSGQPANALSRPDPSVRPGPSMMRRTAQDSRVTLRGACRRTTRTRRICLRRGGTWTCACACERKAAKDKDKDKDNEKLRNFVWGARC
jgi:hypothetical protein